MTVADVMRHQAGLTRITGPGAKLDMEDFFTENLRKASAIFVPSLASSLLFQFGKKEK